MARDRGPAARERRLRRAVARLRGCLDELGAGERLVLVLRAGVGPRKPRSRRAVARMLDLPRARVRQLERSGLRHARARARAGACRVPVAGAQPVVDPDSLPAAGGRDDPRDGSGAGSGADPRGGAEPARDRGDRGAVRSEIETRVPRLPESRGTAPGGADLTLAIALMGLAALAGFMAPAVRARLRQR